MAVLPLVLALGIAVRIYGLTAQSFTMDEAYELNLAHEGFGAAIRAADGFPPLFNLLLQAWFGIWRTEAAARWLPFLLGSLTMIPMYRWGKRLGGESLGLASTVLLAMSPIHVWYSQEVRAYALFFLLAVVSLWRYEVARETGRPMDWIWYVVAVVAGLYTHYYFPLLPLTVVAVEVFRDGSLARSRNWILTHGLIGLLALPLLFLLRADLNLQMQLSEQGRTFDLHALGYTLFSFLAGFTVGPSLRELHTLAPRVAMLQVFPWVFVCGVAAMYLAYLGLTTSGEGRLWRRLALMAALPIVLCWLLTATLHTGYRVRYVVWCAAPVLMLLALGLTGRGHRVPRALALGVLLLVSAAAIVKRQTEPRYANEDARSAAQLIRNLVDPAQPVFVVSSYMALPVRYYLKDARPLHPLFQTPNVDYSTAALAEVQKSVSPGRTFWLLYSRPFDDDPSGRLRDELVRRGALRLRAEVPGLELYQGTGW